MVVGRLLCFSQEVGAKVYQQANLVNGLKQMMGERTNTAQKIKKCFLKALCQTGLCAELKS